MTATLDICICTFRRASLGKTLESLAAQRLRPGLSLRVIVADNDDTPVRRAEIEASGERLGLDVAYVHAPARNISVARNACLDAVAAPAFAFIDDDEVAAPDWAATLHGALAGHDIVFGVSRAHYAPGAPRWVVEGDFHSNRLSGNDAVWNGYTANVILDTAFVARHRLRFDPALGQSGGEDTMFFHAARTAGARFGYAPEAVVDEPTPGDRATLGWLLRRRFRSGQIHALVLREERRTWPGVPLAAAKAAACFVQALVSLPHPVRAAGALLRGMLHAGVVAAALGVAPFREYAAKPD